MMSKKPLQISCLGELLSFIIFICALSYLDYFFILISFILIMGSYLVFCYKDEEMSSTGCLTLFVAISFGVTFVLLIPTSRGDRSGPFLWELNLVLIVLSFVMLLLFGSMLDIGDEWI